MSVPEQTPAPQPTPEPQPTPPTQPGQPAQPTPPTQPAQRPERVVHRTRISGLWVAIGCFAIIVIFLLIFIVQNAQHVDISYLGFHARMQVGIALLFAAIGGILLTVLAGTARILQLRTAARRGAHAEKTDPTRRTASRS
ncbi:MAG TPA: lipopolysaccharide assembly protein LapA domain-containing protein [Streptosporangiaceae bacterium]|nr:lipopolysaccharide assembly protein LapA domain-containing protein [Streptosporangiaceae bacterium]